MTGPAQPQTKGHGTAHHRDEPLRDPDGGNAVFLARRHFAVVHAGSDVYRFDLATSTESLLYRVKRDRVPQRVVAMPDEAAIAILDVSTDGIGAKTRLVSVVDGSERTLLKDQDPSYQAGGFLVV